MNLPSLPTDNLYKFLAISGLLFALIFYVSVFIVIMYGSEKFDSSVVERDVAIFELELTKQSFNSLDSLITSVCAEFNLIKLTDGLFMIPDSLDGNNQQFKYYTFVDSLEREKLNIKKKINELLVKKKQAQSIINCDLEKDILRIIIAVILLLLCVASFIAGAKGFGAWQVKSQIYLDAILMKEAGVPKKKIIEMLEKAKEEQKKKDEKKGWLKRFFRKKRDRKNEIN